MSFVGKILIVVIVVMSMCFMAFAGAVYVTQTNWKTKHIEAEKQIGTLNTDKKNLTESLSQARDEAAKVKQDSQQEIDKFRREALNKTQLLDAKTAELNAANAEKERLLGLAATKDKEAKFRESEADLLRKQTIELQKNLDNSNAALASTKDELFNANTANGRLVQRYDALQTKTTFVEKIVGKYGLPTDPATVEALQAPAPPLDGVVVHMELAPTGRTQYVEVSVGSDDGLRVGHQMDVFRVGKEESKTLYLGRIQIIEVSPDHAVGEVVKSAKNGNIEVGDNVTTKL
jgi:hypothetical protein